MIGHDLHARATKAEMNNIKTVSDPPSIRSDSPEEESHQVKKGKKRFEPPIEAYGLDDKAKSRANAKKVPHSQREFGKPDS